LTRVENDNECQDETLNGIAIHHATEDQMIQDAVERALLKRGRSKEGIIRASGPYVAAAASIATAFIMAGAGR
jgi:hypothetical protein